MSQRKFSDPLPCRLSYSPSPVLSERCVTGDGIERTVMDVRRALKQPFPSRSLGLLLIKIIIT